MSVDGLGSLAVAVGTANTGPVVSIHDQIPQDLIDKYAEIGAGLVELLVVALVVYLVGRFVFDPAVRWALGKTRLNQTVRTGIEKMIDAGIVVVAIAVGFGAAGFRFALEGSALIVAAGTIALGFAAQDALSNFVSGVFIVQDPKLNIGDYVELEETEGTITDIGFRVTRLRNPNNDSVIVPNTQLATSRVRNVTANDPLGISRTFGVSFEDDVEEASRILRRVAEDHESVLTDPEPTVDVTEMTDTALVVTVRFFVSKADRDNRIRIRSEYLRRVTERLDAAGIGLVTASVHELQGRVAVDDPVQSEGEGPDEPASAD